MNVGSSKLILALYIGAALLITGVAFLAFRAPANLHNDLTQAELDAQARLPELPRRPPVRKVTPLSRHTRETEEERRAQRLREMLEERTSLLQQHRQELEATRSEVALLRGECDRYLALLGALLSRGPAGETATSDPGETPEDGTAPETTATQLDATTTITIEQDYGLYELELMLAQAEIGQALDRIDALESSLLRQSEFTEDASKALLAAKGLSVPVLMEMLQRSRPEGRRWAATLLGQLGAEAAEAEPALLVATDDVDSAVRNAAREALRRMASTPR